MGIFRLPNIGGKQIEEWELERSFIFDIYHSFKDARGIKSHVISRILQIFLQCYVILNLDWLYHRGTHMSVFVLNILVYGKSVKVRI